MIKKPFILLIKIYRLTLTPFIGDVCRFHPTCSHYAEEALQKHSLPKALWLTLKRLVRCAPWSLGGYDPVP